MERKKNVKSEKRAAKKKKRRYPVSGRSVFVIARVKRQTRPKVGADLSSAHFVPS